MPWVMVRQRRVGTTGRPCRHGETLHLTHPRHVAGALAPSGCQGSYEDHVTLSSAAQGGGLLQVGAAMASPSVWYGASSSSSTRRTCGRTGRGQCWPSPAPQDLPQGRRAALASEKSPFSAASMAFWAT